MVRHVRVSTSKLVIKLRSRKALTHCKFFAAAMNDGANSAKAHLISSHRLI